MTIFDEKVEPLPEVPDADLVGLSVFTTANAPRPTSWRAGTAHGASRW